MITKNKVLLEGTFACPSCNHPHFEVNREVINCLSCKSQFREENGIYYFNKDKAQFYWGVQQRAMDDMLYYSGKDSKWEDSMHDMIDSLPIKEGSLMWARTYDPIRSTLQSIVDIKKTDRVLEVGPGWGAIALHIAPNCSEYFALDQIPNHVKYIQKIKQYDEKNTDNIRLVCSGNDRHLPFRDNQFDCLILNGVLEWVAHNNYSGKPKEVQQAFLKETFRVLKPNGKLYVGIENRISYKYFRGTPEGHINVMFGALVPRWLTNAFMKWRRDREYREYTYTKWGYSELLKKAGFSQKRFFVTVPQYSNIKEFIPIHNRRKGTGAHGIILTLKSFKNRFAKFPTNYFTPNVGFIGTSSSQEVTTTIENILGILKEQHNWQHIELQDYFGKVSGTGKVVTRFIANDKSFWLSIGINHISRKGILNNIRSSSFFEKHSETEDISKNIPNVFDHGKVEGFSYLVEDFIDGKAPSFNSPSVDLDEYNNQLFDILISLGKLGKNEQLQGSLYQDLVTTPLESVRDWFSGSKYSRFEPWFNHVSDWLERSLKGQKLLLVPTHGDIVPTNTLIDKNKKLWIIDWELSSEKGLPMADLVIFIGNSHRNIVRKELKKEGYDPDQIAFHGYPEKFFEESFSNWLDKYLNELGIDHKLKKPLLFMWWITYIHSMLPLYQFHPKWKEYRVIDIIRRWEKFIDFESE